MNIGLVLSGGFAKGAYQVGALRAISEFIPKEEIKYVSAASIGVLNGYGYLTDNLDRVEELWKHICPEDTRLLMTYLLRSSLLQQNIKRLYDPSVPITARFYCSLLDMSHWKIVYKDLSKVPACKLIRYMKAAIAMPVYNKPVVVDRVSYYDGGTVDNIPVFPLMKHNVDYVICMYFDDVSYKFENTYFNNKIINITFPCETAMKHSLVVTRESIDEMIRFGYEHTKQVLTPILGEGHEDLDRIYRTIDQVNRSTKNPSLRITTDMVITNINKVTQKLTRRKII